MKIALLSPIAWRTPPLQYGPWEQVVSCLAEGLAEKGINVTLFATGNAVTAAKLDYCIDLPYADNPQADAKVNECLHISYLMEKAAQFDIIHNHFDFLPLTYSRLITTPMLTTVHGFSSERIVPVYKKYNKTVGYVSISNANRHPELDYIATVYNGIDTTQFSLVEQAGDYLLFFGRIHPEKGAKEAIQTAKAAGKKLILAGLVQDQAYFNEHVAPFINGDDIVYAGNCGPAERNTLLGNALGLLHLISFDEPFGLSVAEAMCCGTPVIAVNRGAMAELIEEGKTGFLVAAPQDAVKAVKKLPVISRAYCRQRAIERFSAERMTNDYIKVYQQLLNQ